MTTPTAVIFDLDGTLIRACTNRAAAWRDHLEEYAAAIRPHETVTVADAISSCAARFWLNPNPYDDGCNDLEDARRKSSAPRLRNAQLTSRN